LFSLLSPVLDFFFSSVRSLEISEPVKTLSVLINDHSSVWFFCYVVNIGEIRGEDERGEIFLTRAREKQREKKRGSEKERREKERGEQKKEATRAATIATGVRVNVTLNK
jgi:hypothetical protein